jgi:predicted HNH restriction endonuclease
MTTKKRVYQKERYQKHKEELKVERNRPENKAKMKEYIKEYNKRPEVILRKEERDTPENKEKMKVYLKKNYQKHKEELKVERDKLENKEKTKIYMEKWIEENKEHMKEYRNRPENKARAKAYHKEYNKEYLKRPKVKARKKKEWAKYKKIGNKKRNAQTYNLSVNEYNTLTKKCALCGFDKYSVDLHHIDLDSKNNTKENFIGLCPNCHLGIHRGHIKISQEELPK